MRLHHLSLGRNHFDNSVHWQRGLVLDNDYNSRALLVHHGNDIHITVRAAYPQGFLSQLTDEVKYLVESFWEGLRCDVMVRCLETPGCEHSQSPNDPVRAHGAILRELHAFLKDEDPSFGDLVRVKTNATNSCGCMRAL